VGGSSACLLIDERLLLNEYNELNCEGVNWSEEIQG
jgi:hypothetical protein